MSFMNKLSDAYERAKSFSILELLVTMSVITILAGSLIPIIASVRRTAHRTVEKKRVYDIKAACRTFADYHGRMPLVRDTTDPSDAQLFFKELTYPTSPGPYLDGPVDRTDRWGKSYSVYGIPMDEKHPLYNEKNPDIANNPNRGTATRIQSMGPNGKNDDCAPGTDDIWEDL